MSGGQSYIFQHLPGIHLHYQASLNLRQELAQADVGEGVEADRPEQPGSQSLRAGCFDR